MTGSLHFKLADRGVEFEAIHRLNYRTFVEEIPQHSPNAERRLVDRFHAENTYVIGLDGEELVGMVASRCRRPFSLDGNAGPRAATSAAPQVVDWAWRWTTATARASSRLGRCGRQPLPLRPRDHLGHGARAPVVPAPGFVRSVRWSAIKGSIPADVPTLADYAAHGAHLEVDAQHRITNLMPGPAPRARPWPRLFRTNPCRTATPSSPRSCIACAAGCAN
jgi:hypothetical protein